MTCLKVTHEYGSNTLGACCVEQTTFVLCHNSFIFFVTNAKDILFINIYIYGSISIKQYRFKGHDDFLSRYTPYVAYHALCSCVISHVRTLIKSIPCGKTYSRTLRISRFPVQKATCQSRGFGNFRNDLPSSPQAPDPLSSVGSLTIGVNVYGAHCQ